MTAGAEALPETEVIGDGRPPRCVIAIVGLILALLLVLPWTLFIATRLGGLPALSTATAAGAIGGLLAVAFGVIGIVRTSKRRRRNRGVAIVAIPLGLLAALSQYSFGLAMHRYLVSMTQAGAAVNILRARTDEVDSTAKTWFDNVASARFKVAVSEQEFKSWLQSILDEYGQLQSFRMEQMPTSEHGALRFRFSGQFVNRGAKIELVVGIDDGRPRIDDIRVGNSSPTG